MPQRNENKSYIYTHYYKLFIEVFAIYCRSWKMNKNRLFTLAANRRQKNYSENVNDRFNDLLDLESENWSDYNALGWMYVFCSFVDNHLSFKPSGSKLHTFF